MDYNYDLERKNANQKMDEQRIKEDLARCANRKKQAAFKDRMRKKGFRQRNVWVEDPPEGKSEVPTVFIHSDLIGIADKNPEIGNELKIALGNLVFNKKIIDYNLYSDICLLLRPLGKIFESPSQVDRSKVDRKV
jgi:hypothetical protein